MVNYGADPLAIEILKPAHFLESFEALDEGLEYFICTAIVVGPRSLLVKQLRVIEEQNAPLHEMVLFILICCDAVIL